MKYGDFDKVAEFSGPEKMISNVISSGNRAKFQMKISNTLALNFIPPSISKISKSIKSEFFLEMTNLILADSFFEI